MCVYVCVYLRREEALDPVTEEGSLQHAADGGSLSRAASEQQAQQRAQVLGVMQGDRGVGPPDDLQNQVLHVAGLKLSGETHDGDVGKY